MVSTGGPLGQRLPVLHRAQRPGRGGEADPAEGAPSRARRVGRKMG